MSACVQELAALLHLAAPSSASSSSLHPLSSHVVAQSQVEYALPSPQLDIDPQLIPVLLLTILTLIALTAVSAIALLLRRLLSRPALPASAASPALPATVAALRHDKDQLQSALTIAQHALQLASKKAAQDDQKHDAERRLWKAERRDDEDRKKEADRRLGALKKEVDILNSENKRLKEERSRDKEEADTRRKEELKRKDKAKKDERDERERRDRDDKKMMDDKSALHKQLDERVKELKLEQQKSTELQTAITKHESSVQRLQNELKDSKQAVSAQAKAVAPSTPAKSTKREDDRKWEEMTVVMAQLQQQNSSLQQQMEHEQQRLHQQQQLHTQQHDQHAAEAAEKESHRRNRSAEKAGTIQQLRDQLQAVEQQLNKVRAEMEAERMKWEARLEELKADSARWQERVRELEMECEHEEEKAEELQRQLDDREAEKSRLESEWVTEQENRAADLISQIGVKGLEVAEAKQWQDDVKREMQEEFKGRDDDVAGAELRKLLGWPAATLTRKPVTRPAPITSARQPAFSAPSSPALRSTHAASSVPSSPTRMYLLSDLADKDEQLRRAKLLHAESPKSRVSRKQKQKLQRQRRDDVMQLLKEKQQLEKQLHADERREHLPPVPLFDAPGAKDEREEKKMVDVTAAIGRLIAEKTAVEEQLTALQQSTVSLAVHDETVESLKAAQSQLATLHQQLDALRLQQSSSGEELEQLKHAQLLAEKRSAEVRSELRTVKEQADAELSDVKASQQQLVQQHEEQSETLKESVEKLTASQQANDELTTKLDSLTGELTQTKQQLAGSDEQLRALEQSTIPLDRHSNAVDSLSIHITTLNEQLNEQRTTVATLTTQLHDIEAALRPSEHQPSTDAAATETERPAALTHIGQLQADLAQARTELLASLERLSATVSLATHQEALDRTATSQSELNTLRQQLAQSSTSHTTALAQTDAEITQLRADITAKEGLAAQWTDEKDWLLRQLRLRSEELSGLMAEKEELFFLNRQQDERIQSLDTQLAAHGDTIQQLQTTQQQVAQEKDQLGDELFRALQHYQRLEADLEVLKSSSQAAVLAAEDEVDRLRAERDSVDAALEDSKRELDAERQKEADREKQLTKLQAQHDKSRHALSDMEQALSGFMEDLRLKEEEMRDLNRQLVEKQDELATLQQHFIEQKKQETDSQRASTSNDDGESDERDALNESIVALESAIKHSVAHREQTGDAQGASGVTGATPLRPRRFMFVDVKGAQSTPMAEQPATPRQHNRLNSAHTASSPRSLRSTASPSSPLSSSTTASSAAVASPTTSSAAAAAASAAAALANAQSQLTLLRSDVEKLHSELKAKDDALAESQRNAEHAQHTIERLRRHAQGKRDSASCTLSSLHASQLKMEELNQKISAKMQQHYHSRQSSQQHSDTSSSNDSRADGHARTNSAPSTAAASGDVTRLLAQLSAEQSRVMEQAQALTALRAQQQTEAVYHSTLVQRLEQAEATCKKLKHRLHKKQQETDGINAIIEQAGAELAKVVEESNERAAVIEQQGTEAKEWKGRWDELQGRVDDWAESEHKAWHTDKKESKKDYLKRRWHELTYGGHRHCASCERAAAAKAAGKGAVDDKHHQEPHSASAHGHRTPVKGKGASNDSNGHSKRADQLQVPGARHHRSLSDDDEHLQDAHSRHHGHHERSDSQVSVDGEQLDQSLIHSHSPEHSHVALDTTTSDIEHCLNTCTHAIDSLKQHTALNGIQKHSDLITLEEQFSHLAAHIKHVHAQAARPDLSLVLPTLDQSVGSPFSLRSIGSTEAMQQALGARRVRELEAELHEERHQMATMEAELLALKEENLARRQDDEEVHNRLRQVKQLVRYQHSRKPSSVTSVTSVGSYSSASSAVSSAFAEEQKEAEEQWALDEQEALIRQLTLQCADAQREIEQLQVMRREDEERINLAVQELRNSRERVMHDYAEMKQLNRQYTEQRALIEQLTEQVRQKDSTIAQLRADIRQLTEQHEADVKAANLSLRDESMTNPLTLSMVDTGLAMYQQAVEEKDLELKDLRSLASSQETAVAKLTRENKELRHRLQLSKEATTESAAVLEALGEATKGYRAERRLREKLQEDSQLPLMTPIASPIHSRGHSAAASASSSAASSPRHTAALVTPSRMELAWWQHHRRRSSGAQSLLTGFSTPGGAVRSALANAFVSEPTGNYTTPAKLRGGQHSRQSTLSVTAGVEEEKTSTPPREATE